MPFFHSVQYMKSECALYKKGSETELPEPKLHIALRPVSAGVPQLLATLAPQR
jgi:hypothetical protein